MDLRECLLIKKLCAGEQGCVVLDLDILGFVDLFPSHHDEE